MLKEVKRTDLVKGTLYSDNGDHKNELATILMFDHFDKYGDPCFKYHSGKESSYIENPNGFISFNNKGSGFYELPESEQVNP